MTGWVVGVDGCRGGWVAIAVALNAGHVAKVASLEAFADVRRWCDDLEANAAGVDMPIGFPADGVRESDGLARQLLGPRRASLFPTPAHATLQARSWDEALDLNRAASGKGISKQAFNLLPKSRQVRASIQPNDQPRFSEVHPETSLAVMAQLSGWPPLDPKKQASGRDQRQALLAQQFGEATVEQLLGPDRPTGSIVVDVLDALAAAWTARRMTKGSARVLGGGVDPDGFALTVTV